MPSPSSARTSPMTVLVASSAVMAVPLRPTTARAVRIGPSSRTITTTMSLPIRSVAPTRPSWPIELEMTRKLRMPLSSTTSGTASSAVKRSWLSMMRTATRRPARGRDEAAVTASNAKRASAPPRASQRVVPLPRAARNPITGSGRVDLLQPFLRLRVLGEDLQGLVVVLGRFGFVAAVLIEQSAAVVGECLGRHVARLARLAHVGGKRRQLGLRHQLLGHRLDDLEQFLALLELRIVGHHLHDFTGLHVDDARINPELAIEVDEVAHDHVFRADQLPDLGGGGGVDPALLAQVLLVEEPLRFAAVHDTRGGVLCQLADEHSRDALFQGIEVLLVLAVGPAVLERQDRDAGPRILRDAHRGQRPEDQGQRECHPPPHKYAPRQRD